MIIDDDFCTVNFDLDWVKIRKKIQLNFRYSVLKVSLLPEDL